MATHPAVPDSSGVPQVSGWRIGALLGEGATGSVYQATGAGGEEVAIKFLHDSFADEPEMVTRFKREAQTCQRLRSPHIAQVIGAGRTSQTYWIMYRLLRGETLSVRLRRETVMAGEELARPIEHVLAGLAVAHAERVVHRDIKPANIMIERTPTGESACLMDFGISKDRSQRRGSASHSLTSATATLGTINYMPPEQIGASAEVDHRADLYAAGVVAYRAISGRLPYVGSSQGAVLHAKLNTDARTLGEATGQAWPMNVEAFFRRALAGEPRKRFGSAEAMLEEWRLVARAEGVPAADFLRGLSAPASDGDDTVLDGPAAPDAITE